MFKLREHRAEGRMSSCLSQLFATNLTLLGTKKASTSILVAGPPVLGFTYARPFFAQSVALSSPSHILPLAEGELNLFHSPHNPILN